MFVHSCTQNNNVYTALWVQICFGACVTVQRLQQCDLSSGVDAAFFVCANCAIPYGVFLFRIHVADGCMLYTM